MTSTTLDELWRVFGWSTNALLTGITPRQDYMQKAIDGGEWIADGLRAALIQLRGDSDFYVVSLGFRQLVQIRRDVLAMLCSEHHRSPTVA